MASPDPAALFTLPIPPCPPHPGGSITASRPAEGVYLLTLFSPPDNRLTTPVCEAFLAALDILEFAHAPAVVVTTSAIPKFYSNGLDLAHANLRGNPTFLNTALYPLFRRFLTYPCPTVALLNGHAFAGGLMLAMHHDYRVMNPSRGFACVNELEFGVPLMPAMSSIFRDKVSRETYRTLVLEARRFGGPQALEAGVVDALGGLDAVLRLVEERGLVTKAKTGIYGLLKMEMYRETVGHLESAGAGDDCGRRRAVDEQERRELGRTRVDAMLRAKRAKL